MSQVRNFNYDRKRFTLPTVDIGYYWRVLQYSLWMIASKAIISVVIFGIMCEGLRIIVPPVSEKLSKLPFLHFLKHYEETRNLDLAMLFAIGLIFGVWVLLSQVIEILLDLDKIQYFTPDQLCVLILGLVLLGTDLLCFYFGISEMGWGSGGVSFFSILATAAYASLLIFCSWFSVNLKRSLKG